MKTYLFDFDGTLVDSMDNFASGMLRILRENGIDAGEDVIKIITPLGYMGTAAYFQTLGVTTPTDELLSQMHHYIQEGYFTTIPAKESVSKTLQSMKARGYSLNVLTASPHTVLEPCLERLGLLPLFDHVWSCDDFATTKSDPKIYRMAAERLGKRPEDVIFVDDNVGAVRTAKEAGMRSYGIYDPSSEDFVDDMKQVSDRYVRLFSELLTDE